MSDSKFTISPKKAKTYLEPILRANLCPILTSSPGIGKSTIAKELAKQFNLKLIDIRLSTIDPLDLTGFLVPDKEAGRANYLPPSTFPLKDDPIPEGYSGWLMLLDELTSAMPTIQAPAYRLILDREVGEYELHPNCLVMAAGNSVKDNAVAYKMSTALQSRMIHFELKVNSEEWIEWAIENKLHPSVIAYVEHKPTVLSAFDPSHADKTFPCPRTLEMLSKVLQHLTGTLHAYSNVPIFAGTIGEGAGLEFRSFLEVYKDLIKFETIITNPTTAPIPDEPSALFALTGVIGERANDENINDVMTYVNRIPVEHQVSSIRKILANNPMLKKHQSILSWVKTNAAKTLA